MSDIGKSGDAVTQPSKGYSLKPMFMFISCIIMNIVMFNCCLNVHTCTWIVSLTVEDHVWFEDRWMVASLCDE
jgi:hypothetical protein